MLKYLFRPYYSVFECIFIMCAIMLSISYSFWFVLLAPIGAIIQVIMTNNIRKQESMKQGLEQ